MAVAAILRETVSLNLPENSDCAQQQEVLDALPALVFLERAGRIVFANAEARQMLGLTAEEWVERPVEDVLWGLFPGTAEPQTHLIGSQRGSPFHATMPTRDGRLLPVEGTHSILNAELREAVIVAHPSGRERAPKSRLMEDVLASIPDAVAIVHDDHVLYTNPAFTRMFGYSAEEVSGGCLREMIVPETRRHEHAMLQKALDEQGRASMETVRVNKAGELLDVVLVAGPLLAAGARIGYVLTYRDIGERKQTEAKLQHDAMHDMLTGLPNRALFLDRLSLAFCRRSRHRDQSCGVLFLDLDRFKEINDTLGHAAGDVLLVTVAERLRASLRPQDSASRLGGDEFAVLVENILEAGDLNVVANRILREMERPFEIFGHQVHSGASIGVAMAGPDHMTPEMLIRDADFAMYRAKQEGGGRIEIFDKRLEVHVTSHKERERELRLVLDKRQFEVWYQPIYRLENGKLEGFESVLRWRQVDGSADSSRDLLRVAEDTGLSITLGRETIDAVCRQLRDWSEGLPQQALTLTINLTHRQFYHADLIAQLQMALEANAVRSVAAVVWGGGDYAEREPGCGGGHSAAHGGLQCAHCGGQLRLQPGAAQPPGAPAHRRAEAGTPADRGGGRRRPPARGAGVADSSGPQAGHAGDCAGDRDGRASGCAVPHGLRAGPGPPALVCAGSGAGGEADGTGVLGGGTST